MKTVFRSNGIAFEPSKSGFIAYIFNDGNYLNTLIGGEDGLDVLNALLTALTPTVEEIEKELLERSENLKRDVKFYEGHKWNTKEKEAELKAVENKLTTLRSIKENIKSLSNLVEAYFKN